MITNGRYLNETRIAVADANGFAFATIAPPQSDFWAVSLIRVSTKTRPSNTLRASTPFCSVFHGAVGVLDSTTLLDETTQGAGDSSSIISGAITMRGITITAQWFNATPGEICILTIYGRAYDNILQLQSELAPVPGVKFSGNGGGVMTWVADGSLQVGPFAFNAATPLMITPSDSYVELQSVTLNLNTSAVVANRTIGIRVISVINAVSLELFRVVNSAALQPASVTWKWSMSQGINNYNFNNFVGAALPSRILIPPNSTVIWWSVNTDAGDTWDNSTFVFRRYTSRTLLALT